MLTRVLSDCRQHYHHPLLLRTPSAPYSPGVAQSQAISTSEVEPSSSRVDQVITPTAAIKPKFSPTGMHLLGGEPTSSRVNQITTPTAAIKPLLSPTGTHLLWGEQSVGAPAFVSVPHHRTPQCDKGDGSASPRVPFHTGPSSPPVFHHEVEQEPSQPFDAGNFFRHEPSPE